MPQTLQCPDCRAHLELPSLAADQSVQCPRCQHVFVPAQLRPTVQRITTAATPVYGEAPTQDDGPAIMHPGPLAGGTLAKVAMALLFVSTCAYGVELYFRYEHLQLLEQAPQLAPRMFIDFNRFRAPHQPKLQQRWADWERSARLAKLFHYLTFWPTTVMFLLWLGRASKNAGDLGAQGRYFHPARAVLTFFIPILNLVWPYMALQEIWRASDPEPVRTPRAWQNVPGTPLVLFWWICFLSSTALYLLACFVSPGEWGPVNEQRDTEAYMCLSRIAVLIEGPLLILIVHRIMQRQADRHARLCALSFDRN